MLRRLWGENMFLRFTSTFSFTDIIEHEREGGEQIRCEHVYGSKNTMHFKVKSHYLIMTVVSNWGGSRSRGEQVEIKWT